MELLERTPLYLGIITVCTAVAAVTAIWAGVLSFGITALVVEAASRLSTR